MDVPEASGERYVAPNVSSHEESRTYVDSTDHTDTVLFEDERVDDEVSTDEEDFIENKRAYL